MVHPLRGAGASATISPLATNSRSVRSMTRRTWFQPVAALVAAMLLASCTSSDEPADSSTDQSSTSTAQTEEVDLDQLAEAVEMPGEWAVGTPDLRGDRSPRSEADRCRSGTRSSPTSPRQQNLRPILPGYRGAFSHGVVRRPPAAGDFPLVIYSHGNGGLRYVSAFLTEHLASHGFVVMAPDHTGNTASTSSSAPPNDRPGRDRPPARTWLR